MIGCLDLEQRPKLGLEAVFPTASGQACLKALADGKGEPRGLIRFVEFAKRQEGIEAVVERGPVAGKTGTECLKTILRSGRMRSEERRVGKECVSTCRSRWSPYPYKNNTDTNQTPP